ncbi:S8 family serine peptidase [Streptacidiphilus sp. N1-12]|uniref:S8 family serine peptidase n=2 Tax=Streptacidiphilus alkalitolerans TaxID=3342712 RepID=A0ABV6VC42_9ACTN
MQEPPWLRPRPRKFPGVPAWGAPTSSMALEEFRVSEFPEITPEWAWGGADGSGVRVCVVDTGVDAAHPAVGGLERAASVVIGDDGTARVEEGDGEDLAGHGTACAGIIRSLAPAVSLSSVRVLTKGKYGSGGALLAGLTWAVEQRFDVVNLSLSTTLPALEPALRELADLAYFRRCALVVSAHNMPVQSYPWNFSSVISVASHNEPDPLLHYYNAAPPVDFFARGVKVTVPWTGGREKVGTGNSFAAPHVAGLCALVLGKHRWLTPFQLKTVLFHTARNVTGNLGGSHGREREGVDAGVVDVGV